MQSDLATQFSFLREFPQFILWEQRTRPGQTKPTKVPVNGNGEPVSATDPANFLTYDAAIALTKDNPGRRLGFCLTKDDPFFVADLDGILDGGNWAPHALEIYQQLAGSCPMEISTSGKGWHFWGLYEHEPQHKCKNTALGLELYTRDRFIAFGDQATVQGPNLEAPAQSVLDGYVAGYFDTTGATYDQIAGLDWDNLPDTEADAARVQKALAAADRGPQRAFDNPERQADFRDLWERNVEVLARTYPASIDSGKEYDGSSADLALANALAFWSEGNAGWAERMMWASGLRRDKWEQRQDYVRDTVAKAIAECTNFYNPSEASQKNEKAAAENTKALEASGDDIGRGAFMDGPKAAQLFEGCVYVYSRNEVLTPAGMWMSKAKFNVFFGGRSYVLDAANSKVKRDAWEAFTNSDVYSPATADSHRYDPKQPQGAIFEEEGTTYINTYIPVDVPRVQGDVQPFLNHVARMIPNERDREILFGWMCACVRYPGVKFGWAPVIQGVQGNGKSMIATAIARAIGERHTHVPRADEIASKFNAWVENHRLAMVEDIDVRGNRSIMEILKPMITATNGYEIQAKGVDQMKGKLVINFIFTMNQVDGMVMEDNERRYAMFITLQQCAEDRKRDMPQAYLDKLWHWLDHEDGWAKVSEWLYTREIPAEFDPTKGARIAPETSTMGIAVDASRPVRDTAILEAIGAGVQGFRGGFISATMATRYLQNEGYKAAPKAVAGILDRLGYVRHPALSSGGKRNKGRTPRAVAPDGVQAVLYCLKGAMPGGACPQAVLEAYEEAQRDGV